MAKKWNLLELTISGKKTQNAGKDAIVAQDIVDRKQVVYNLHMPVKK